MNTTLVPSIQFTKKTEMCLVYSSNGMAGSVYDCLSTVCDVSDIIFCILITVASV